MMKCRDLVKEVSLSREINGKTTLITWFKIQLHLVMCVHCRNYIRQLQIMKQAFSNLLSPKKLVSEEADLEDLKKRILKNIN